jgi:AraC-like DNA-binding protein
MVEIADLAGFQSLRSFNAAFQQVYRLPPSQLRRPAKPSSRTMSNDLPGTGSG